MSSEPWFNYEIDVYSSDGEFLEGHSYPGDNSDCDFPNRPLMELLKKFGGIGYEFRIRTRQTKPQKAQIQ